MDNSGNSGLQPSIPPGQPVPVDAGPEKPPVPQDQPVAGPAPVSRAPLNLGGGASGAPVAPSAAAPRPVAPRPMPARPAAAAPAGGRITGCKTFFTKLHPGAIDFLDEQINQWLKDNPSVVIKLTNTTVGDIQAKKTEPNILITVWYSGRAAKTASHM
jgi:hypothetical protein